MTCCAARLEYLLSDKWTYFRKHTFVIPMSRFPCYTYLYHKLPTGATWGDVGVGKITGNGYSFKLPVTL